VALSADSEENARRTVESLGLSFPVLYGLDAGSISRTIGCYSGSHQGRPHIQPTAFILGRDGVIAHTVYSSGKVGRLTASDALTIIKDLKH